MFVNLTTTVTLSNTSFTFPINRLSGPHANICLDFCHLYKFLLGFWPWRRFFPGYEVCCLQARLCPTRTWCNNDVYPKCKAAFDCFTLVAFTGPSDSPGQDLGCATFPKQDYPLTRNYYENNSLRIIFRNFQGVSHPENSPRRKDFFKELRIKFVIFQKWIFRNHFSVSNSFVSEGTLFGPEDMKCGDLRLKVEDC